MCSEWQGSEYTVLYHSRTRHLSSSPHVKACHYVDLRHRPTPPVVTESSSLPAESRCVQPGGWSGGDSETTNLARDWTKVDAPSPGAGLGGSDDTINITGPIIGNFNVLAQMAQSALREPGTAPDSGDNCEDIWMNDEAGQVWEGELAAALAHTERIGDEGDWTPFASKQVR